MQAYDYRHLGEVSNAWLNLYDEYSLPRFHKFATYKAILIHPEWFHDGWLGDLSSYDRVFCKTHDAHRIFSLLTPKAVYTGIWSRDLYDDSVEKEPTWVHLAGGSLQKNTEVIKDAWRLYPDLPPLTLISSVEWMRQPIKGITYEVRLSDADLRGLLNRCLYHLTPSSYEGYGHVMWESLSTKAVLVTIDAPPMSEVGDVMVPRVEPVGFCKWRQSLAALTTPEQIAEAVRKTMALSSAETKAIQARSRERFLANLNASQKRLARHLGLEGQESEAQISAPAVMKLEYEASACFQPKGERIELRAKMESAKPVVMPAAREITRFGVLPEEEGRGWYLPKLLSLLDEKKGRPLNIVETGTLRNSANKIGDGWSTLYMAEWAKKHNSHLTSVDIDPKAIDVARKVLAERGLLKNVDLLRADSVSVIEALKPPIDFVYLDSAGNDITEESIANALNLVEYQAVSDKLDSPALVVIDDCYEVEGFPYPLNGYCKGVESLKRALAQNRKVGRLHRMAVISHGFDDVFGDLPTLGFILPTYLRSQERIEWARRSFASLARTRTIGYMPRLVIVSKPGLVDVREVIPANGFSNFQVAVLTQPEDADWIDAAFAWGLGKLFDDYPEVTHGGIVQDDFVYNSHWLEELYDLIFRHPDAKCWHVYRSNNVKYCQTLTTVNGDMTVTCINGPGTISRQEWKEWNLDYRNLSRDGGLDVMHPRQRPGERWVTEKSYIQSIGIRGEHNSPEIGEASLEFVGEDIASPVIPPTPEPAPAKRTGRRVFNGPWRIHPQPGIRRSL